MLGRPFLFNLGDSKGALENYPKAARIAEALNAADPANKLARRDLAMVYMRIGTVLATDREIPESLRMLDRSAAILESIVAASPKGTGYRSSLALIYEFKGERLKRLRKYRQALGYYQRSLELAAAVVAESPKDYSSRGQMLNAEAGICGLLATLGERTASLEVVSKMIASAHELAVSRTDAISRSYLAKALAWAGDSYVALAGNAGPSVQRNSDWRLALTYYRRAEQSWAAFSEVELKPYRQELKLAQRRIAECRNALAR